MCPGMLLGTIVTLCSSNQCCNCSVRLHILFELTLPPHFSYMLLLLYCRTLSLQFCCICVVRIISFLPILHEVPVGLYVVVVGHGSISLTLSKHSWMIRPKTVGDISVVVLVAHLTLSVCCLHTIVSRFFCTLGPDLVSKGTSVAIVMVLSWHILWELFYLRMLHICVPLFVATRRL